MTAVRVNPTQSDTGWIWLSNVTRYRKVGSFVTVVVHSTNVVTIQARQFVTVGTLPQGARPAMDFTTTMASLGADVFCQIGITASSGAIQCWAKDTLSYFGAVVTFPV